MNLKPYYQNDPNIFEKPEELERLLINDGHSEEEIAPYIAFLKADPDANWLLISPSIVSPSIINSQSYRAKEKLNDAYTWDTMKQVVRDLYLGAGRTIDTSISVLASAPMDDDDD